MHDAVTQIELDVIAGPPAVVGAELAGECELARRQRLAGPHGRGRAGLADSTECHPRVDRLRGTDRLDQHGPAAVVDLAGDTVDLVIGEDGSTESHLATSPRQPVATPRGNQRVGQIGVGGDAGDQCRLETGSDRSGIGVDHVAGMFGQVAGRDGPGLGHLTHVATISLTGHHLAHVPTI